MFILSSNAFSEPLFLSCTLFSTYVFRIMYHPSFFFHFLISLSSIDNSSSPLVTLSRFSFRLLLVSCISLLIFFTVFSFLVYSYPQWILCSLFFRSFSLFTHVVRISYFPVKILHCFFSSFFFFLYIPTLKSSFVP